MKERALLHQETLRRARASKENSPLPGRRVVSVPDRGGEGDVECDALLEQINNVESYLSKARQTGDPAEISALESNLNELQIEYGRMINR